MPGLKDDPGYLGHLGHFFGGSSGSHSHTKLSGCDLVINFRKSSVIWFKVSSRSTGFSYPPISIDGVELTMKQKYLGLIFDCSLSWGSSCCQCV